MPSTDMPRIALVVSRFDPEVAAGLREGALALLREHGVAVAPGDEVDAPGAFEVPLIAQTLARTGRFDGVVCLGCVIKGDTAHFEHIAAAAASGLMTASLATGVPLAFGILTTYDDDQALRRSRPGPDNKGREAAAACLAACAAIKAVRAARGA